MPDCATIRHLQAIASSDDGNDFKGMAYHALKVIEDIGDEKLTSTDVASLEMLVEEIYHANGSLLLSHLQEGAPDCQICKRLLRSMETR